MDRKTVLWIVIAILFLGVLFVTFKVGAGTSANAITNTANAVQSASSSGAMVGGC
ncbi:MAG: hypothetical protein AABX50_02225 [Nanoarchaeota archaeon]